MADLVIKEVPSLRQPTLVAAFSGWPDAAEAATGAVRYLGERLEAVKFAEILPENFYMFTLLRPQVVISESQQRTVIWPSNDFFYWRNPEEDNDLVLLLGAEPHLKWHGYIECLMSVVEQCQVSRVVSLGGTMDNVPHTIEPHLSGSSNDPALRAQLEQLSLQATGYQGPTSIHSAIVEACQQRGIPTASMWGHAPHYLQASPNPMVCHALLRKLTQLLGVKVDLGELRRSGMALERRIDEAMAQNAELRQYVEQLEQLYREGQGSIEEQEPPSPGLIIAELEEFLRNQREEDDPSF